MKTALGDYLLIEKWSDQMGGVFSLADLENLFNEINPVLLHRRIAALIKGGVLMRFKRGFYLVQPCSLDVLSQRLYPDSYLSLGTVLARHLLIGSIPAKTAYSVRVGRNRVFASPAGNLVFCSIAADLFFGYDYENGIRYATAEKAYLDTLYFYQKGFRFSFDVRMDINGSLLNRKELDNLLTHYNNPKFIAFVKGVIGG